MTIHELLAQIPAGDIKIQRIDQSILSANKSQKTGITKLTIETLEFTPNDLMAVMSGKRPKMHGLILWIPSEKLPQ